ncbi:MAG: acetolactate decarboxylase [Aeriscardovia sp.]|nr:acetolactate decarboxylase [Aeriscardovia sp.]
MEGLIACALFQNSLMSALLAGDFEGKMTVGELLEKGDLGLGTFEGLDGEMAILEGKAYKMTSDGKAREAGMDEKSPFAAVADFSPSIFLDLEEGDELEGKVLSSLPGKNYPCAVHVKGRFKKVVTRTVSKREKPWGPMKEAVDEQKVCQFEGAEGDVVGFWTPKAFEGPSVAGFHLHFISRDRSFGGHILSASPEGAKVEIAFCPRVTFSLPQSPVFASADLCPEDLSSQIAYAEKTHR